MRGEQPCENKWLESGPWGRMRSIKYAFVVGASRFDIEVIRCSLYVYLYTYPDIFRMMILDSQHLESSHAYHAWCREVSWNTPSTGHQVGSREAKNKSWTPIWAVFKTSVGWWLKRTLLPNLLAILIIQQGNPYKPTNVIERSRDFEHCSIASNCVLLHIFHDGRTPTVRSWKLLRRCLSRQKLSFVYETTGSTWRGTCGSMAASKHPRWFAGWFCAAMPSFIEGISQTQPAHVWQFGEAPFMILADMKPCQPWLDAEMCLFWSTWISENRVWPQIEVLIIMFPIKPIDTPSRL